MSAANYRHKLQYNAARHVCDELTSIYAVYKKPSERMHRNTIEEKTNADAG